MAEESWQTFDGTSGYVRPERVNNWPNCMIDMMMMMMMMMTKYKDVPHEIRNINLTNALTFRSVTVKAS